MSDYVIGDVQGCYSQLQRLLDAIDFNEQDDCLWFVGDLVNRGPESLAVLRFIKALPKPAKVTLGNHDLHLLSSLFCASPWKGHDDTIDDVLNAPDGEELGHWLRHQNLIYYDEAHNTVMCHAGIAPVWNLEQALMFAKEVETVLQSPHYGDFLTQMYGNEPSLWSPTLQGIERLRAITNYCTRMRFCDNEGRLVLTFKGQIKDAPKNLYPWYNVPCRKPIAAHIVFGHWAALQGQCEEPGIDALDTGCLWGGSLTAMRLQDKKRFSVPTTLA